MPPRAKKVAAPIKKVPLSARDSDDEHYTDLNPEKEVKPSTVDTDDVVDIEDKPEEEKPKPKKRRNPKPKDAAADGEPKPKKPRKKKAKKGEEGADGDDAEGGGKTGIIDLLNTDSEEEEFDPDTLAPTKVYPEAEPAPEVLLPLLPFQKEFLHWAQQQEAGAYKGGILADEMGMGKTIQTIALICTNRLAPSAAGSAAAAAANGPLGLPVGTQLKATLVVCPVVAVIQWCDEISKHVEAGKLNVVVYHGPKRNAKPEELLNADVVVTTYSVLESDYRKNVLPNKVACDYCAKKYFPLQLKMHLTFWCGPDAQKTEAQSKTMKKGAAGDGAEAMEEDGEGAGDDDGEGAEEEEEEEEDLKGKGKAKAKGGKGKGKGKDGFEDEEEKEEQGKGGKGGFGKGKGKGGERKKGMSFGSYWGKKAKYLKEVQAKRDAGEESSEDEQPPEPDAAQKSPLHSVKWHRIVLDEAHCIKDRRSNTSKAVFALSSSFKWALSGTPLQNRVAELYSQIRFIQADPFGYYFCKACDCKCLDWRFGRDWRKCDLCGHSPMQHWCWWNRNVANPIRAHGYQGKGRKALMVLKHEVLEQTLLRRTKEQRADDLALPPRFSYLRRDVLDEVEEDFYQGLYTQSQVQFSEFVQSGTVLNNYAHIFDLLIRLRQAVCHPYLVMYSAGREPMAQSKAAKAAAVARGEGGTCGLCSDPLEDGVLTGCGHPFCRVCMADYVGAADSKAKCPTCNKKLTVDLLAPPLSAASASAAPSGSAAAGASSGPKRKSILSRIDTGAFKSSTKIEGLREELANMLRADPSAKALVFSQFTSMLELIQFRLERAGVKVVRLDGSMTLEAREKAIDAFNNDNTVTVFLMSLKAGGVALNLTAASHVFLMDPWWNPAVEKQAADRIHRLGQYRPITVIRFVVTGTIEDRLLKLQEKKLLVFESTVGRSTEALTRLTAEDLAFLFQ